MPLMPKRVKYRKLQLRRIKKIASSGNRLSFGEFGLQAKESAFVSTKELEAARVAANRFLKRGGKLWIRVFPDISVSAKPAETRMGGGKGSPEYWVAKVSKGKIIFELSGIKKELAQEAMRLASHKLSIKTRFLERK